MGPLSRTKFQQNSSSLSRDTEKGYARTQVQNPDVSALHKPWLLACAKHLFHWSPQTKLQHNPSSRFPDTKAVVHLRMRAEVRVLLARIIVLLNTLHI